MGTGLRRMDSKMGKAKIGVGRDSSMGRDSVFGRVGGPQTKGIKELDGSIQEEDSEVSSEIDKSELDDDILDDSTRPSFSRANFSTVYPTR